MTPPLADTDLRAALEVEARLRVVLSQFVASSEVRGTLPPVHRDLLWGSVSLLARHALLITGSVPTNPST